MQLDQNSRYVMDKLSEINLLTEYRVDQAFIDAREAKIKSYKDNNGKKRTEDEKRLDIDCEFVDEMVRQSGKPFIGDPVESRKHDFSFTNHDGTCWFVDNKIVHEDVFWLHMNKYMQYLTSYNQGMLHYFAFWKYMDRPSKPLKVGDKPELLLLSVIPAGQLLHKMCDPKKMTKDGEKYKVCVV